MRGPKNKNTALHVLASLEPSDKDSEMACILMQKGARPDFQNKNGHTAVSLAIQKSNFALARTLISKFDSKLAAKAEPVIDWLAVEEKRKKGVDEELLLNQGDNDDDVSVADGLHLNTSTRNDWMTPLMIAIQLNPPSKPQPKPKEKNEKTKKQQQIAEQRRKQKLVRRFGANVGGFTGTGFHQNIGLQRAHLSDSDSSSNESEDEEEKLREKEKEEEEERERSAPGETPKQESFRKEQLEIIEMICKESPSSSIDVFTKNGDNALTMAIRTQCSCDTDGYKLKKGSTEIVHILMQYGADPNAMNNRAETVISNVIEGPPSDMLPILTSLLKKADVNKELVVYESKEKETAAAQRMNLDVDDEEDSDYRSNYEDEESSCSDSDDESSRSGQIGREHGIPLLEDDDNDDDDNAKDAAEQKGPKIKCRKPSYLTLAVRMSAGKGSHTYSFTPKESTKYKVVELLLKNGAKLKREREIPIIIQIIKRCAKEAIFQSSRFEEKCAKNAGNKENSIGFQLFSLVIQHGKNLNLNVVDKPKMSKAKSLLWYIVDLIKTETESRLSGLTAAIERVKSMYSGRDSRVIAHKKKLYRDRVFAVPLISPAILQHVLSKQIEINEDTILQAIKLPTVKSYLSDNGIFEEDFQTTFEPIAVEVCKLMLDKGNVDLNKFDHLGGTSAVNPAYDTLALEPTLRENILKMLIKNGLNINRTDSRYNTPLLVYALQHLDASMHRSIDLLVKHGLNVNNCRWKNQYIHSGSSSSDKPDQLDKHPVELLVEMGAGLRGHYARNRDIKDDRHRPEILDAMLRKRGIDVLLQGSYCVTMTKSGNLSFCAIGDHEKMDNLKEIEVEMMAYKCKIESEHGTKWEFTKQYMCDHMALTAYPNAYRLFKKHYKEFPMEKRLGTPLWKQSAEILINCQWSMTKARMLYQKFKRDLSNAIVNENEKRVCLSIAIWRILSCSGKCTRGLDV